MRVAEIGNSVGVRANRARRQLRLDQCERFPESYEIVCVEGLVSQALYHFGDCVSWRLREIPDGTEVWNIEAAGALAGRDAGRAERFARWRVRVEGENSPQPGGLRQMLLCARSRPRRLPPKGGRP